MKNHEGSVLFPDDALRRHQSEIAAALEALPAGGAFRKLKRAATL